MEAPAILLPMLSLLPFAAVGSFTPKFSLYTLTLAAVLAPKLHGLRQTAQH